MIICAATYSISRHFISSKRIVVPGCIAWPPDNCRKGTAMDPKTTAVILIEYQNDFTSDGGTLHGAVQPVMESTNMLANTVETVQQARDLGATIIHAPITF